jgi:hypothetical protein
MKVIKKTKHFIIVVEIIWPSGIYMDQQREVVVFNFDQNGLRIMNWGITCVSLRVLQVIYPLHKKKYIIHNLFK